MYRKNISRIAILAFIAMHIVALIQNITLNWYMNHSSLHANVSLVFLLVLAVILGLLFYFGEKTLLLRFRRYWIFALFFVSNMIFLWKTGLYVWGLSDSVLVTILFTPFYPLEGLRYYLGYSTPWIAWAVCVVATIVIQLAISRTKNT